MAGGFQLLDGGDLFGGLEPAPPFRNAQRRRNWRDRLRPVSGQNLKIKPSPGELLGDRRSIRPQALANGKDRAATLLGECDGRRARLSIGTGSNPAERRTAEPCLAAVDQRANALPGLFDRTRERRALAGLARERRGQRMAAGQRQPRRAFQQVWIMVAAFSTRGSGSVSVPVLSNTTVSASARRSIASPALRMTPHGTARRTPRPARSGWRARSRTGR